MDELLAHAATQFGLFTRAQAHRCGVSDRMLRHRVDTHLFERLSRGVFRVRGAETSWHQAVLAACLSGGVDCIASHRTAAALHGFDGARMDVVEVTVPRSVRYKSASAIVHQSLDLETADRATIGPIPLTTPARTLIDLGAVRGKSVVEESFDAAERDHLVYADYVARRHAQVRKRGRRGVGPMSEVLERRRAVPPKYVIERRFLRLLEAAGVQDAQCQYELIVAPGRHVYMDVALPPIRLGWELDGHGAHSTRRQRAADYVRASEIEDLGWQLRRFSYEQVMYDQRTVVRLIRSAVSSRSCGL